MLPAAGNLLYRVAKPRIATRPRLPVSVTPPGASLGAPSSPAPSAAAPSATYDYSTDPQLQAEEGNALTARQTSQHGIDARQRLALLGFGNRALAMKTLGLGAGDPFIQSIDENADTGTGTLARLAHAYAENERSTEQNLNKRKLYYSSARTKALADLAYSNSQQIAEASRGIQGLLEGLTEEGANAGDLYNQSRTASEGAAHDRALAFALQYPQAAPSPAPSPAPSLPSALAALAAAKKLAPSTALTMYTK